jgi:hypothetical protein
MVRKVLIFKDSGIETAEVGPEPVTRLGIVSRATTSAAE